MAVERTTDDSKNIIIAVISAVIILVIFGGVVAFLRTAGNQMTDVFSRAENAKFEQFNGGTVAGSIVRAQIQNASFPCTVYTKKNVAGINYGPAYSDVAANLTDPPAGLTFVPELGMLETTSTVFPEIRNDNVSRVTHEASNEFINKDASFYQMIVIDVNGTMVGVVFQQVGATGAGLPIDPADLI